jgi:MFS family permease
MATSSHLSRRNLLALCVFLDLFAVSLIVPLLPVRYKELGVEPVVIGMIGSVYSIAQIVGGLVLGVLSDRLQDRRTVLLMSFAGAAVAYAMVGAASTVWFLVLSRVVVGLFKQTMTASKAMAAAWSDDADRAEYMGLINSMATAAWVTGSAVTGFVRSVHPAAPSVVAVALYAIDAAIVIKLLPPTASHSEGVAKKEGEAATAAAVVGSAAEAKEDRRTGDDDAGRKKKDDDDTTTKAPPPASSSSLGFVASCKRAFGNGVVGRFLVIRVFYGLVVRASMTQQV